MSNRITIEELKSYLWNSAVLLRTNIDAGAYKQYIFPLLFFKRICDVYDEETQKAIVDYSEEVYGKNDRDYRFVADLAYVNPKYDLALLKTEPDAANKPVEFCYDDAFPGEDVYVIGNSKGEGLCILEGIVSDVHRSVGGKDYIMISAPVTRGNSGGPVFNSEGKLIGVVKGGHSDVNSMNFVIPIKTIIEFLQEAKDKEDCDF